MCGNYTLPAPKAPQLSYSRNKAVPNYNLKEDDLDPKNYWRGPVWINTNWLLMQGLARYGFAEKVKSVREDILELVNR